MNKMEIRDADNNLIGTIGPAQSSYEGGSSSSIPDPRPDWAIWVDILGGFSLMVWGFFFMPVHTTDFCAWLFGGPYIVTFLNGRDDRYSIHVPVFGHGMLLWAWYKTGAHLFYSFVILAGGFWFIAYIWRKVMFWFYPWPK